MSNASELASFFNEPIKQCGSGTIFPDVPVW
jgi:hypothetical protein